MVSVAVHQQIVRGLSISDVEGSVGLVAAVDALYREHLESIIVAQAILSADGWWLLPGYPNPEVIAALQWLVHMGHWEVSERRGYRPKARTA